MDPAVWGPTCWKVMLSTAFRLPARESVRLFEAMRHLLPCSHCRESYAEYCRTWPPAGVVDGSSDSAALWVWAIKDRVNRKLGSAKLPFSTLARRHAAFSSPCTPMDVADLMLCIALHADDVAQDGAYAAFVEVMSSLLRDAGFADVLPVPVGPCEHDQAWLHALQYKNALLAAQGRPVLTADECKHSFAATSPPADAVVAVVAVGGGRRRGSSSRRRGDGTRRGG